MRVDERLGMRVLRALGLAALALLGLLTIVGSGGGFPPCEGITCNTGPPPPMPRATVQPEHVTALVGTPVTFSVSTSNLTGNLFYQWMRRSAGSANFADIAGATGTSYTLPSVNLADDGAQFLAVVVSSNGPLVQAIGHLAVTASPGLVFADGEYQPQDWRAIPVPDPAPAGAPGVITERIADGGNPGAFQRMSFQVPQGTGSVRVFYVWQPASYDPSTQGAVYVIDYAEDCRSFQDSTTTATESRLVIEQAGRHYISDTVSHCTTNAWGPASGRASLAPADFRRFDGPECLPSESCPDFSASAAPMHFGFWRISYGMPGDTIVHGIDNWKVTVWRR